MIESRKNVIQPERLENVSADLDADHLCPFCGMLNPGFDSVHPCRHCLSSDTPATRGATRSRLGPWFVFQARNPAAPGLNYATIVGLIRRGQVKPRTVVRGPTTSQLWQFACSVRGLSREFGVCFDCGKAMEKSARVCLHCHKNQDPPANPDVFIDESPAQASPAAKAPAAAKLEQEEQVDSTTAESPPESPKITIGRDTLSPAAFASAFGLGYRPEHRRHSQKHFVVRFFKAIAMLTALALAAGVIAYFKFPQWQNMVDPWLKFLNK